MAIFITGGTGYLGAYATDWLLRHTDYELALLVRAEDYDHAIERLWRGLQFHMAPEDFHAAIDRLIPITGDLTEPRLGIATADYDWLISNVESIIHSAAALNFRSETICFNHNLRGTMAVINLARSIQEDQPLRRFTYVSTAAVLGKRPGEQVMEDVPLDWMRPDYNPYTRTKKFGEHMVAELLADVSCLYLRPSAAVGDSRFPRTTQFDMLRTFCALADLPVLPISPDIRVDLVNADWCGAGIAQLHLKETLPYDTFHLSAGTESRTAAEILESFARPLGRRPPRLEKRLQAPFERLTNAAANMSGSGKLRRLGSLIKVLMPHIVADTIYDNTRSLEVLGTNPIPFTSYAADLYTYAKSVDYQYPYEPFPEHLG